MSRRLCVLLLLAACGSLMRGTPLQAAAESKSLPPPVTVTAPAATSDPARADLVRRLAAAKAAGDVATARALDAVLCPGARVGATAAPLPANLRPHVIIANAADAGSAAEKWGGDARISSPALASRDQALACDHDGTWYATVWDAEINGIRLYRSPDHGTTWIWDFAVWHTVMTPTEPNLAIARGIRNRLIFTIVHGSGAIDAMLLAYVLDLDSGQFESTQLFSAPYAVISQPRLCVDNPEYSYWYPYAACTVEVAGTHEVRFFRSLDFGDTWSTATTLATGLTRDDYVDIDFGGQDLAITWSRSALDADVYLRLSSDFGGSWGPALSPAASSLDETQPRVAIAADGSTMLLAFARRYGPSDRDIDGVFSLDRGSTWQGTYLPFTGEDETGPALCVSPVTGRFHAAIWRNHTIQYTASSSPPLPGAWSPALRVDDRGAAVGTRPAAATRPTPAPCNPDLNCDGVIDATDVPAFELAMSDPAGYAAVYPHCDIDQADLDLDADIDIDDQAILLCLVNGGTNCCEPAANSVGLAWTSDLQPKSSVWFDAPIRQRPSLVDYLLVVPDALAAPAQRLANWRTLRGHRVATVYLSDLGGDGATAAGIDAWLESWWAVNRGLRYVALVGSVSLLPSFPRVDADTGDPFFSDLPYACLEAWYPYQYMPQLMVGRLPVTTAAQLDDLVDRIAGFESRCGGSGGRVVFFGGNPELSYVAARDSALAAGAGFAVTVLRSPTEAALMTALNAVDTRIAMYYGHGSASANWPLHSGNLGLLTNHLRPLLYFSGGCSFNDDTLGYPPLGHELLLCPGGATAQAGAAVAGGYGYAYEYAAGLLANSRRYATVGELNAAALQHLQAKAREAGQDVGSGSSTRWFAERLRFLGDPGLRIDGDVSAAPLPASAARLLEAIMPNPFNAATTIAFTAPAAGYARMTVHDAAGRRVVVLVDGFVEEGRHTVAWRGDDGAGRSCASGVYFVRVQAAGKVATGRLTLLK